MKNTNHKTGPPRARWFLLAGALLILALALYACAPAPTPTAEPTPVPSPIPPTPTSLPDQSDIVAAWQGSIHNIYDLYYGPNTWCARCHSPQNWDPAATPGRPPNCFSCKFPQDAEVRVANGNDLIPQEEWVGIPCSTCHVVNGNGIASSEIAWQNPITDAYVAVNNSTELCEKCHTTTTNNLFGSAVSHKIAFGSAHLYYAGYTEDSNPPPQYCTDCHDPHSLVAKTCEDCHTIDEATHAKNSYASMKDTVTCMACHDASAAFAPAGVSYGVGPFGENSVWVPVDATLSQGEPANTPIVSHAIQGEVVCTLCHSAGNAYGLVVLTAAGAPAPTPTAAP